MWYRSLEKNISFLRTRLEQKKTFSGNINRERPIAQTGVNHLAIVTLPWKFSILETSKRNLFMFLWYDTYYSTIPLHGYHLQRQNKIFYHLSSVGFYSYFFLKFPTLKAFQHSIRRVWRFGNSIFFMKLKFDGKGYHLFKLKRGVLSFQFGHSHRVYRRSLNVFYKLTSKVSIFLWGGNWDSVFSFASQIRQVRRYNQYTGKGIRFSRQIIYRKLGKVGSYR